MRWLILLWQEIIKIVPEVLRLCVVLLHHMGFWVLFKAAFKQIKRRIVPSEE
jgi:hypothetical protein